jgi:hypothetical protein
VRLPPDGDHEGWLAVGDRDRRACVPHFPMGGEQDQPIIDLLFQLGDRIGPEVGENFDLHFTRVLWHVGEVARLSPGVCRRRDQRRGPDSRVVPPFWCYFL